MSKKTIQPENTPCTVAEAVESLRALGSPVNAAGMARYGINTANAFGVSVREVRALAKCIGKNTPLALELLDTPYHEAHALAFFVMRAEELSEDQLDRIVATLDSWDTCDLFCGEITAHPLAFRQSLRWIRDERTFVRRAGFSLMARMSVRCKDLPDEAFQPLLALIEHYSWDDRPMVTKAIDWALRQIGKRSTFIHPYALSLAEKMVASPHRATRRVGRVAARELTKEQVIARLKPHTVWPEEGIVEIDGYC